MWKEASSLVRRIIKESREVYAVRTEISFDTRSYEFWNFDVDDVHCCSLHERWSAIITFMFLLFYNYFYNELKLIFCLIYSLMKRLHSCVLLNFLLNSFGQISCNHGHLMFFPVFPNGHIVAPRGVMNNLRRSHEFKLCASVL